MDLCLFGDEKFRCPVVDVVLFVDDRCPPPDRPLIVDDLEFMTAATVGGGPYGPTLPAIDVAGEWLKGGGGTAGKTATGGGGPCGII